MVVAEMLPAKVQPLFEVRFGPQASEWARVVIEVPGTGEGVSIAVDDGTDGTARYNVMPGRYLVRCVLSDEAIGPRATEARVKAGHVTIIEAERLLPPEQAPLPESWCRLVLCVLSTSGGPVEGLTVYVHRIEWDGVDEEDDARTNRDGRCLFDFPAGPVQVLVGTRRETVRPRAGQVLFHEIRAKDEG